MKKAAIYARVSINQQTCENQLTELRAVANRAGYQIVSKFMEEGISGAKGRLDRPALDQMLKDCAKRRFDLVICWDILRLGRSVQNLIEIMNELQSLKVNLSFLKNALVDCLWSARCSGPMISS
ncbi:MAG: recombinase family protein [Betaproteobacteria bacterium]|nr:recombinase family protein [Betaproteobacteria bacterium]